MIGYDKRLLDKRLKDCKLDSFKRSYAIMKGKSRLDGRKGFE